MKNSRRRIKKIKRSERRKIRWEELLAQAADRWDAAAKLFMKAGCSGKPVPRDGLNPLGAFIVYRDGQRVQRRIKSMMQMEHFRGEQVELVTAENIAHELGVSRQRVSVLLNGKHPAYVEGRTPLYHPSIVQELRDRRRLGVRRLCRPIADRRP